MDPSNGGTGRLCCVVPTPDGTTAHPPARTLFFLFCLPIWREKEQDPSCSRTHVFPPNAVRNNGTFEGPGRPRRLVWSSTGRAGGHDGGISERGCVALAEVSVIDISRPPHQLVEPRAITIDAQRGRCGAPASWTPPW